MTPEYTRRLLLISWLTREKDGFSLGADLNLKITILLHKLKLTGSVTRNLKIMKQPHIWLGIDTSPFLEIAAERERTPRK